MFFHQRLLLYLFSGTVLYLFLESTIRVTYLYVICKAQKGITHEKDRCAQNPGYQIDCECASSVWLDLPRFRVVSRPAKHLPEKMISFLKSGKASLMKKIVVRKTQAVKLTSSVSPLYGSTCRIILV
jgi:hypothetical protein